MSVLQTLERFTRAYRSLRRRFWSIFSSRPETSDEIHSLLINEFDEVTKKEGDKLSFLGLQIARNPTTNDFLVSLEGFIENVEADFGDASVLRVRGVLITLTPTLDLSPTHLSKILIHQTHLFVLQSSKGIQITGYVGDVCHNSQSKLVRTS